ncbi:DNA-binding response regulator [candidate division WWE3 bacterium]|jgi:DNA-binding response OmpR family regulator|uniref:DNA-binding response regulator n=1 Tax=candidate division WWE3 bacterium TaxID=2053526 RepID=A0A3A4ZGR6_UNCKA|nr:MAG: DNA-binding response regulator [candidate division WWE3 bacterium]
MKILIVEDDKRIAHNIQKFLKGQNYVVDIAADLSEGNTYLESSEYELVILDWMLPDGVGVELCEELRKKGNSVPILMLTAKSQIEDKLEGFDCGADDYMTKPFDMNELLARIRAVIRRKSQDTGSPVLSAGNLKVNINTCEVSRGNKDIMLSPKEYAILEYLILNKCKVLSRMEIIEHVWGDEIDPFSNTVDVHINYLRTKVDSEWKKKLILTVKNRGYMICDN